MTLIIFVLLSAFHFGQQHWESKALFKKRSINDLFYLNYGLVVLFMLFTFNSEEVTEVILNLTSVSIPSEVFLYGLFATAIVFSGIVLFKIMRDMLRATSLLYEIFLLLLLFVIN